MGDNANKTMAEATRMQVERDDEEQRTPEGADSMGDGTEGAPSGGVGQSDAGGRQAPASGMAQQHVTRTD